MKENVLDVLMYLFENYMYDEPEDDPDRETLQSSLLQAGFSSAEISKAFDWLDGLATQRDQREFPGHSNGPLRLYTDAEHQRMDAECRGLLLQLENAGVLDGSTRELVIDRVMALDAEDVELEDLKWVVLMVLFNQPGQEANYAWMENYLFDSHADFQH